MWYQIVIFIILFLLYLHWAEQYKTGEDLEIYEIDYTDNEHLQEVCKSKQPIVFEFSQVLSKFHFLNTLSLEDLADKVGKMDVYVKDTEDYWDPQGEPDAIPLTLESSLKLFTTDTHAHYISEGNEDLIKDTILEKYYDSLHEYIQPSFTLHKTMDLWFGSKGSATPIRYNTDYSHFLYLSKGKCRVRMTPHKSKKYLHYVKDYERYEFRSLIHLQNPQADYKNDLEKIQWLDFDMVQGNMLFIPPYWWYSLEYLEEGAFLCSFQYNTIMNILANGHNIATHLYKKYTTKTKPAKVLKVDEREEKIEEIAVPI